MRTAPKYIKSKTKHPKDPENTNQIRNIAIIDSPSGRTKERAFPARKPVVQRQKRKKPFRRGSLSGREACPARVKKKTD